MELCALYFNNHEKIRMELILKEHYFKLFAFRLKPIFVYQRIALYFFYLVAKSAIMSQEVYIREVIKDTSATLKDVYSLIVEVHMEVRRSSPVPNPGKRTTSRASIRPSRS